MLIKHFGARTALAWIGFDPGPGETVAVVGRSGCGKTTRLRPLAGPERVLGGNLAPAGQHLTGLRRAARRPMLRNARSASCPR